MKLYEINERIDELMLQFEPDPETGEISDDMDAVIEEIGKLQEDRYSILQYLAKLVIENRGNAAMLKDEEKRLKERRGVYEHKAERILEILDRECAGEKTDLGIATVNYRKSTKVDIKDNRSAINWLAANKHENCCRFTDPEINKTEVKKLIQAGTNVPGIELVQDISCSLK